MLITQLAGPVVNGNDSEISDNTRVVWRLLILAGFTGDDQECLNNTVNRFEG